MKVYPRDVAGIDRIYSGYYTLTLRSLAVANSARKVLYRHRLGRHFSRQVAALLQTWRDSPSFANMDLDEYLTKALNHEDLP